MKCKRCEKQVDDKDEEYCEICLATQCLMCNKVFQRGDLAYEVFGFPCCKKCLFKKTPQKREENNYES